MSEDFEQARATMIACQLRPNHIDSLEILSAMAKIPRERFVANRFRALAYSDQDIPLGDDKGSRRLMAPMLLARLIQEAEISSEDLVLDIGCGSGYSTAVLACLAGTVIGLESKLDQANSAVLTSLGLDNAVFVQGDLSQGYPSQGPYDAIIIAGMVGFIPEKILDQLIEGGRLVTVLAYNQDVAPALGDVSPYRVLGRAVCLRRRRGLCVEENLFDAQAPPLFDFWSPPAFVF